MTPEEAARSILDSFDWPLTASNEPELRDMLKNAINNAATREREACAKVAEHGENTLIAAAIRNRK